ncbi:hypothetical protein B0H14DRAFT_2603055 [Mycena olivaceomarginata]|nr:hypothetical protein B0H14DRAFT_2603055 [Mycena olivaceomarginata]
MYYYYSRSIDRTLRRRPIQALGGPTGSRRKLTAQLQSGMCSVSGPGWALIIPSTFEFSEDPRPKVLLGFAALGRVSESDAYSQARVLRVTPQASIIEISRVDIIGHDNPKSFNPTIIMTLLNHTVSRAFNHAVRRLRGLALPDGSHHHVDGAIGETGSPTSRAKAREVHSLCWFRSFFAHLYESCVVGQAPRDGVSINKQFDCEHPVAVETE